MNEIYFIEDAKFAWKYKCACNDMTGHRSFENKSIDKATL